MTTGSDKMSGADTLLCPDAIDRVAGVESSKPRQAGSQLCSFPVTRLRRLFMAFEVW
jgi:hypothetical protein